MDSIIDVSLLMENDPELSKEDFKSKHSIFSKLASEESIEVTRAALEMKRHEVSVVDSGAEALDQIKAIIPNGAEVYHTGSVTLRQVGLIDELKNGRWVNLQAKALADSEGNGLKRLVLARKASNADFAVATIDAVTEEGDFLVADASLTRTAPFVSAGKVIIVVGSNKITKDLPQAHDRLKSYVLPLESARVRKAYGIPGTMISNLLVVSTNSFSPGRLHFILVKEALGF